MKQFIPYHKTALWPIIQFAFMILLLSSGCMQAQQKDNTLTQEEKDAGFQLLFDGKTLEGWKGYKNQSTASWSVDSGTLHGHGGAENYGAITADLSTVNQYEDFELSLDFKISPQGNSGILYLVTEALPYSYESGPEYQIVDDLHFPEKLEDWQRTAANYGMNPAPDAAPHPAGEWNHARIIKNGNHVEHWLNGKKVVEYELHSPEWNKNKEEGKWKDYPQYGASNKGFITFQNHGSEVWFKNVKIKEL